MHQQEITDVVNCIGDFIQEGDNLKIKRTKAIISYLEYLWLKSTDIFKKVTNTLQRNQIFIGEELLKGNF